MAGETVFDVFGADAFSLNSLTDFVNRQPFLPQQMSDLGIWDEQGISTTSVELDIYDGLLNLIPSVPRGGPSNQNAYNKRKAILIKVPHLPLQGEILADEMRNVRAFGTAGMLQSAKSMVEMRLMEIKRKHDATCEYQRIKAIQGTILDADGASVLLDIYAAFGKTQTSVDFLLGTGGTKMGAKVLVVLEAIKTALGALSFKGVVAFCGATWFSRFVTNDDVQKAYAFWMENGQQPSVLRDDLRFTGFTYYGITFVEYFGSVGGIDFVPTNEAYAFPILPDLYKTYFAPSDYIEDVGAIGAPMYARVVPEPPLNKRMIIDTQSNPISIAKRPEACIKLTTST